MSPADYVYAGLALCVVIMLHEAGHYITAVWSGMKVDRFSIFGIGPAIVKLGTWRGTEFVISAIPFGAYVLIRGMEAAQEDTEPAETADEPSHNFRDKPLANRALVIAGGPIANYITAMVIFLVTFAAFGVKQTPYALEVSSVTPDSPAHSAGLLKGDRLLQMGETAIEPAKLGADLKPSYADYHGKDIPIQVLRDGEVVELVAAVPEAEDGVLGFSSTDIAERAPVAFGTAASLAVTQPFVISSRQLVMLGKLITGQVKGDVSGPVGIVRGVADAVTRGLPEFLMMTAMISTLLGLFNLLPVPALDGGRLGFLLYEAVARRRANARVEELVHGYGMLALLGLIALVTIGDIRRLF